MRSALLEPQTRITFFPPTVLGNKGRNRGGNVCEIRNLGGDLATSLTFIAKRQYGYVSLIRVPAECRDLLLQAADFFEQKLRTEYNGGSAVRTWDFADVYTKCRVSLLSRSPVTNKYCMSSLFKRAVKCWELVITIYENIVIVSALMHKELGSISTAAGMNGMRGWR